ncbi:MAG: ComF family protein [Planctomycetota bacterium]
MKRPFERAARRVGLALQELAEDGLDALWPRRCWLCGTSAEGAACEEHAIAVGLAGPRCGRCSVALPPGVRSGELCRGCRRRAPPFASVSAAVDYRDSAVRPWLLAFKHGGRFDLAVPLADLVVRSLAESGRDRPGPVDRLVPVPLHPARRLERGFDQAARLAVQLERRGLGVLAPHLARTRATEPQGAPTAPGRRANVEGAFRCIGRPAVGTGTVWLVDDVLASGATAAACARVLRRSGVERVRVLVVARA